MVFELIGSVLIILFAADPSGDSANQTPHAKEIILQIYPESIVSIGPHDATLGQFEGRVNDSASGEHGFLLRSALPRTRQHPTWEAYVLAPNFGDSDSAWIRAYLSGEEEKPNTIVTPALIVSPKGGDTVTRHVAIGDGALTVDLSRAEIGSLIGDGNEQLLLTYRAVFYVDDPREIVVTTMADLYQLPSLELAFRGLLGKQVTDITGNVYDETPMSALSFADSASGKFKDIVVSSAKKEQERYTYNGERYMQGAVDPVERRSEGVQERLRLKTLFQTKKTLSIRVVNDAGAPVAGARVSGETREPTTLLNLEPPYRRFRGATDERGEFSVETPGSVLIEIEAEGYYKVTRNWPTSELPSETQTIVMEGAPEAVPMIEVKAIHGWRNEQRDRLDVGIQFRETVGTRYPVVFSEEESDLWFEFVKVGKTVRTEDEVPGGGSLAEHNTAQWRIRIRAQNGWTLVPGPGPVQGGTSDSLMRSAPESGYVDHIELQGQLNPPRSFYLKRGDGERYGKIYDFKFRDSSWGTTDKGGFALYARIQSEDTGSTSLNPRSPLEMVQRAAKRLRGNHGMREPHSLQTATTATASASPKLDTPDATDPVAAVPASPAPVQPVDEEPPEPHTALSEANTDATPVVREDADTSPSGRTQYGAILAAGVTVLLLATAVVYRMKRRQDG